MTTTCNIPATGARVKHYYVEETTCGTTPANPVWTPIRFTSGNLQLTRDSLQSAELDGSREIQDIRLGQQQATGEISFELAYNAYTDLLGAAFGSSGFSGSVSDTNLTVTVNATTKRFTRSAGDYTVDGVMVGDIIQFADMVNAENEGRFVVTEVSALYVVVDDPNDVLVAETATASVDYATSNQMVIGNDKRTFSIMTHYQDADSGAGEYHIIKGCEITGVTLDISVNSMVTGTFSIIGRTYTADTTEPAGSTYNSVNTAQVYASVDGRIYEGGSAIGYVTSLSYTLDNGSSAQFEIGSTGVSFVERGRANSTFSMSTFFTDSTLLNKFLTETETSVEVVLDFGGFGAMALHFPRVVYTSGTPEVGGEGSITQSFEGQALYSSDYATSVRILRRN